MRGRYVLRDGAPWCVFVVLTMLMQFLLMLLLTFVVACAGGVIVTRRGAGGRALESEFKDGWLFLCFGEHQHVRVFNDLHVNQAAGQYFVCKMESTGCVGLVHTSHLQDTAASSRMPAARPAPTERKQVVQTQKRRSPYNDTDGGEKKRSPSPIHSAAYEANVMVSNEARVQSRRGQAGRVNGKLHKGNCRKGTLKVMFPDGQSLWISLWDLQLHGDAGEALGANFLTNILDAGSRSKTQGAARDSPGPRPEVIRGVLSAGRYKPAEGERLNDVKLRLLEEADVDPHAAVIKAVGQEIEEMNKGISKLMPQGALSPHSTAPPLLLLLLLLLQQQK